MTDNRVITEFLDKFRAFKELLLASGSQKYFSTSAMLLLTLIKAIRCYIEHRIFKEEFSNVTLY